MSERIRVALAGNPNAGKTAIFNAITGARQRVANYPGVTVETMSGRRRHDGVELDVVDLPGIYSLTPYSVEEVVARHQLIDEKPDVVVDVIDCSNLERNLYLAVQLKELAIPLVLVFNMSDVAKSRGIELNLKKLSRLLGAPIVPTVGHKGEGITDILDTVLEVVAGKNGYRDTPISYGADIETEIRNVERLIAEKNGKLSRQDRRWLAIKLLENDGDIRAKVGSNDILDSVDGIATRFEQQNGSPLEMVLVERRYHFISDVCQKTVRATAKARKPRSDRIDWVVTNRYLGFPIFLGLMYLVFHLTFTLGDPMMGWIEQLFGWLGGAVATLWPAGSDSAVKSLIVDGIIGGVGGVIVFLPNIVLLFLAIGLLDSSGYMARAAFIMDGLMQKIGLHGKSFIPLLIGFGCSVPAIMATRTLESRRDRLTTMLVVPLISCSARLTIYLLIIPAFFPNAWHAPMLWVMYLIGIGMAIAAAKLLRSTVLKGESTGFMMELPPYRLPEFKSVFLQTWQRSWLFLRKAGTLILAISIILWALTSYPKFDATASEPAETQQAEELAHSFAGRIGHWMEPVLRPMGFDWKIGTALIGAFAAKEVFVAQMGIVYAVGDADENSEALRAQLRHNYSPLIAFCIMLFMMISTPCMATIAVTKRESNSWRWAMLQLGGLTVLAYVVTIVVYQVGRWIGTVI